MFSSGAAQNQRLDQPLLSRRIAVLLTLAMTALYALWDFTLPGQYTVAILYASSVVASGWARSRRFVWFTTLLSVVLTYGGLAFGPEAPEGLQGAFYVDRSFVAIGLIVLAAIVLQRMQMVEHIESARDALRSANEELEERVRQEVSRRIEIERELQQAQKMEAIGQLAGGIAHDFNNILTTVIANVEMIRARSPEGDPCRRLAENALLGAKQGASFTKQLLGFARRQHIEPEIVAIDRLLTDMRTLAQPVMPEVIEISTEAGAGVSDIFADRAQLQSALLNLVINARDAMPGGGRITVAAENITVERNTADLARGDYVRLSVRDTGSGMPPEVMARAFEPLFTTKAAGKGTGLGLSMVYGFAKHSGGTARIESTLGRGTTVHLCLPRASLPAPTHQPG